MIVAMIGTPTQKSLNYRNSILNLSLKQFRGTKQTLAWPPVGWTKDVLKCTKVNGAFSFDIERTKHTPNFIIGYVRVHLPQYGSHCVYSHSVSDAASDGNKNLTQRLRRGWKLLSSLEHNRLLKLLSETKVL